MSEIRLRPYQEEARQAAEREWANGIRRTLLILPTGTGKTVVFSKIAETHVQNGERVLILAHRNELLEQAAKKLVAASGLSCAIEQAGQSCLQSGAPVTVGSVRTLAQPERLARFDPSYFNLVIIDEAHHAVSDSYRRVLSHFENARVLGVTATPARGDRQSLQQVFQSVAYEYTLARAVTEGYVTPVRVQMLPLRLALPATVTATAPAGDFPSQEIDTALDPYLPQIAGAMQKLCAGRKTVVFLPLVRTARKFRDILNALGFRAAEVSGVSPDRAAVLQGFQDGVYNVLCNAMLLTEGWDCPAIDCVVILRPTTLRSLYLQMAGRGLRLFPGKTHLLLLDILWQNSKYPVCHPAQLLCENDGEAARLMQQMLQTDGPVDLAQEREILRQRQAAFRKWLRRSGTRPRKLHFMQPEAFLYAIQEKELETYTPVLDWELADPTAGQRAALERLGIAPDSVDSRGQASKLLDCLYRRSGQGLTTPRQIICLERLGFRRVGAWRFEEAQALIQQIAATQWHVPAGFIPAEYVPGASQNNGEGSICKQKYQQ